MIDPIYIEIGDNSPINIQVEEVSPINIQFDDAILQQGGAVLLQAKTANPSFSTQQITPSPGFQGLSRVTINPINSKYGDASNKTVTAATLLLNTTAVGWDAEHSSATPIIGSMPNNGAISGSISGLGQIIGDNTYTIPSGYTSGGIVVLTNQIETLLSEV